MSAVRFSTQVDAFLQAALRYGVSSMGGSDATIQLESSTRQETEPAQTPSPRPAVQAALSSRDMPDRQLLVSLGVCGFDYRLVLLFQIEDDSATRAFFGGEAIQDGLSEFTNLVCGSLNRSLQQAYPSTGMSTPFTMSGSCFDHLRVLRPDLRVTQNFLLGTDVRLRIAYALSVGRTFGFVDSAPVEETSSMGELELF